MSHSRKKFPKVIQEKKDCRYLNRQLRHDKLAEVPKGSLYKRIYYSNYNWAYRWSKEQAIQAYVAKDWIKRNFPTLESYLIYWERCTIKK